MINLWLKRNAFPSSGRAAYSVDIKFCIERPLWDTVIHFERHNYFIDSIESELKKVSSKRETSFYGYRTNPPLVEKQHLHIGYTIK